MDRRVDFLLVGTRTDLEEDTGGTPVNMVKCIHVNFEQ